MPLVQLTARDRETLEQTARSNADARATRRALALLDLADGQTPGQVAARSRVGRSTVYDWAARWHSTERPKPERLRDAARSGRPPEQRDAVAERLAELMPTAPTEHGYRHPAWTTPLLVAHLAREHRLEVSDATVRRALHGLGYRWKRPRFVLSRRDPNWRQAKGGSRGDLEGRERTAVLFSDATILTETPPLRACWSRAGQQAEVPITGNRDKRVVFGALAPKTGAVWFDESAKWNQGAFPNHLRSIRSRWRAWNLVLFVDRGSRHTAKKSRALAAALGIELRFLPTACSELNPVEGLWRHVKGRVMANEPTPDLSDGLGRAYDELFQMTNTQRLQLAGVLSGNFWLPT